VYLKPPGQPVVLGEGVGPRAARRRRGGEPVADDLGHPGDVAACLGILGVAGRERLVGLARRAQHGERLGVLVRLQQHVGQFLAADRHRAGRDGVRRIHPGEALEVFEGTAVVGDGAGDVVAAAFRVPELLVGNGEVALILVVERPGRGERTPQVERLGVRRLRRVEGTGHLVHRADPFEDDADVAPRPVVGPRLRRQRPEAAERLVVVPLGVRGLPRVGEVGVAEHVAQLDLGHGGVEALVARRRPSRRQGRKHAL
jgi:hypothetical protein